MACWRSLYGQTPILTVPRPISWVGGAQIGLLTGFLCCSGGFYPRYIPLQEQKPLRLFWARPGNVWDPLPGLAQRPLRCLGTPQIFFKYLEKIVELGFGVSWPFSARPGNVWDPLPGLAQNAHFFVISAPDSYINALSYKGSYSESGADMTKK